MILRRQKMTDDEFIKLILVAIVCPAALPLIIEESEAEDERL